MLSILTVTSLWLRYSTTRLLTGSANLFTRSCASCLSWISVLLCSVSCCHLGWLSGGGGSGSHGSLLWLQVQRQPVLRHFSPGTFLWHHKFLHFLWPALGGYKGRTWAVIVCLALSSVRFLMLPVTSSRARLSDCLRTLRSLRSALWTNKNWFICWTIKKKMEEKNTPLVYLGW